MKLFRLAGSALIETPNGEQYLYPHTNWDELINRDDLHAYLLAVTNNLQPLDQQHSATFLPPVGSQEVWAAGVTYRRSRDARMEESKASGGDTFYDLVYDAERPELFFKATAQRVVGDGGHVRIRKDSVWNVPEPELALFITANGKIAGYTIGNDMSSRSIEGENPLYLPQAKVYDGSAALGPCLYVPKSPLPSDTRIQIEISRNGAVQYSDNVAISQMKRGHEELVAFLYRECSFPQGCFLMTGTCMVPPTSFTLQSGDKIVISIDGIGTLTNTVA
jgi:2-dehydro-3-deoxy-D-arabinonate dehydratase